MAKPRYNSLAASLKIKHILTYNPAIPFLSTYLREMRVYAHKRLFISALFISAPNWKQPNIIIRWIQQPPLSVGATFQDLPSGYLKPESIKTYLSYVLSSPYIPMIKFNLYIRHSKRLTTVTNKKIEQL